jgi:DNA topoisomerase-3
MATQKSGTVAVLAEKPSVARDIASVLGATSKGDGYLHGTATWSRGRSVTWRRWPNPTR